jgi:hypothetical protein
MKKQKGTFKYNLTTPEKTNETMLWNGTEAQQTKTKAPTE